ncbi:MAG: hypothetical protein ACI9KE_004277 [Polyangiales bacterium]|jgi:hypothetical protein
MAHNESSTPPSAEAKPPGLPEIRDEATATPMWVPGLGLGVFLLATLWMIFSSIWAEEAAADAAAQEEATQEAAAQEAPEPEADPA